MRLATESLIYNGKLNNDMNLNAIVAGLKQYAWEAGY